MKGIDVGTTYINDKYCAKFISAIAAVRKQEQDRIISEAPFMSVISDGATDSSCKEAEIVLVRSSFHCQVQLSVKIILIQVLVLAIFGQ
jgi:hypothetical protein